jgi:hypothetical protein
MGALIVSPALALLTGSPAHADGDLASIGPIEIGGYAETLNYDTVSGAFDNYLVGNFDGYPYDIDAYFDPSGSGNAEFLLTIPLLYQGGFTDVDGTITPISSVNAADFVNPDIGLVDLGGTPSGVDVVSFGPFLLGGGSDIFSINTGTLALDNFFAGTSSGLPFDLDFAAGAPGSDSAEFLLTVPSLLQVGVEDVAGAITPLFSLGSALDPDLGLSFIGGI